MPLRSSPCNGTRRPDGPTKRPGSNTGLSKRRSGVHENLSEDRNTALRRPKPQSRLSRLWSATTRFLLLSHSEKQQAKSKTTEVPTKPPKSPPKDKKQTASPLNLKERFPPRTKQKAIYGPVNPERHSKQQDDQHTSRSHPSGRNTRSPLGSKSTASPSRTLSKSNTQLSPPSHTPHSRKRSHRQRHKKSSHHQTHSRPRSYSTASREQRLAELRRRVRSPSGRLRGIRTPSEVRVIAHQMASEEEKRKREVDRRKAEEWKEFEAETQRQEARREAAEAARRMREPVGWYTYGWGYDAYIGDAYGNYLRPYYAWNNGWYY